MVIRDSKMTIPNRHLAVYVLHILGGDTKRIHTEDIALKCFELFPHSFSWVKHTQYPDKDIVRIALCDARKSKYGSLVEGRAGKSQGLTAKTNRKPLSDGWRLTPSGIEWIRENHGTFKEYVESGQTKDHRQKILRELKRIKDHPLYIQFMDSPDRFFPTIGAMAELLRCRVDAEEEVWEQRFEAVQRKAQVANQPDVLKFIDLCKQACLERSE